jgi:hypothetical protein
VIGQRDPLGRSKPRSSLLAWKHCGDPPAVHGNRVIFEHGSARLDQQVDGFHDGGGTSGGRGSKHIAAGLASATDRQRVVLGCGTWRQAERQ